MDNTNINKENLLPKINTPKVYYFIAMGIAFLVIMLFLIMNDYSLSSFKGVKSEQQLTADIFAILFFSLLIFGLCVLFLPNLKEFKNLFEQISGVTYVILYTIFAILFYTMMSKETLNNYPYIINSIMIFLGGLAFYNSLSANYIDNFNLNYERIKMLILLFCFITIIITLYNVNPGNFDSMFSGSSLLITIILSVFAFLYVIILITLPGHEGSTGQKQFLSNFSSFGVYGSILFVIFLAVMTSIISSGKTAFFANQTKSASVMILLLIISIVWITMLGVNLFTGTENLADGSNVVGYMKRGLIGVFGLVISALLIYWLTYNIGNLSGNSSIMSFVLNILLVTIVLGLIYKTMNINLPSGNAKKNAFFGIITNTLLYIPCLVSNGFDWIGKLISGQQDTGPLMMLVVAIGLIITYFKLPMLFNSFSSQGGQQLVNKPVYTDTQYNLGSYQDLNNGSDEFDYQYAISSWVFIDAAAPNTNPSYNKYTSLLNFGNKPNILYNGSKNELMITMQQKDLKNITKNKLIDFDENGNRIIYVGKNILLQKWNNIIINYNGGTLDVFINGELVKSSIEVVPYYKLDNLTIGENEGIKGGICNVIYFRNALTSSNIYYLYNTVKNRTPPVLNDSSETILTKDIQ